ARRRPAPRPADRVRPVRLGRPGGRRRLPPRAPGGPRGRRPHRDAAGRRSRRVLAGPDGIQRDRHDDAPAELEARRTGARRRNPPHGCARCPVRMDRASRRRCRHGDARRLPRRSSRRRRTAAAHRRSSPRADRRRAGRSPRTDRSLADRTRHRGALAGAQRRRRSARHARRRTRSRMTTTAHRAPTRRIDGPDPALLDACVHCGFCLPACPTYALWSEEMDSPRGRIHLMKAAVEGRATIDDRFVRYSDRCLGCLACVTACPSGVRYEPLIEATRAMIEQQHRRSFGDRLFRAFAYRTFPYRGRMRLLLLPLAVLRPVTELLHRTGMPRLLPRRLAAMLTSAPPLRLRNLFRRVPAAAPAGAPRLRAGLLTGCVQQLLFPDTNAATVRVLAAEGCDVLVPSRQGCCGALALHGGRIAEAKRFARRTIAAFERA